MRSFPRPTLSAVYCDLKKKKKEVEEGRSSDDSDLRCFLHLLQNKNPQSISAM
jgi:hypothetical protein